jgi:hypothetical protein
MPMIDNSDDRKLACDMIDVHGTQAAAAVARENARTAALAGQVAQAKSWIKVLGMIQQPRASKALPIPTPGNSSSGDVGSKK